MPTSCSAVNCKNRRSKEHNRSFFRFPLSNPELCKKWIIKMKRYKWTPTKASSLCSDHFVETCFRFNNDRRSLLPGSVPTIFNFPDYLSNKTKPRPAPRKRPLPVVPSLSDEVQASTDFSPTSRDHEYCLPSPRKVKKMYEEKNTECQMLRKRLHAAKQDSKRQREKCDLLKKLQRGLKQRLCETGTLITDNCFDDVLKDLLLHHSKGSKNNVYPDMVKTFALTLHFYSARAYTYLRKFIKLPHPRTIRHWALAVDGKPGFTEESFAKIASEVESSRVPILGCLMLDEIALKKQVDWDGKQVVGRCDLGNAALDNENCPVAKEALVFMLTTVNQSWKIPIGYCLINGLSANTRINLINQYLRKLHETGVKVVALTCDGTTTNKSVLEGLGVEINGESAKSWFAHPADPTNKVYCLLDAAHMLKLMRNLIGEKELLLDGTMPSLNNKIEWHYFAELEKLQSKEGLHAANKLRRYHIEWQRQKMKVSLAAQTLSNSVGNSMEFCRDIGLDAFLNCGTTVKFIKKVDVIFDLLNSCHPHGVGTKHPITQKNKALVLSRIKDGITYLKSLKLADGKLVWNSKRGTPLYGLVLDLLSIRGIAEEYLWGEDPILKYFLTRRLSQDHLELFFASIRNRGGNNNNPTALQFRSAYRKCLIARIDPSKYGNCDADNNTNQLVLDMQHQNVLLQGTISSLMGFDHDYVPEYLSLSVFCENVIQYISGNVVRVCAQKLKCSDCVEAMYAAAGHEKTGLIKSKDVKNGLVNPAPDVVKICTVAETTFRSMDILNKRGSNLIQQFICLTQRALPRDIFKNVPHLLLATELSEETHFSILLKIILKHYFTIRIHHMCREESANLRGAQVRQVLTKLILFKGQ